MAKYCAICGKKLGFRDGKIDISDGTVCVSCWSSAGFDMGIKSLMKANQRTTKQLQSLIELEALNAELEKASIRSDIAAARA